MIQRSPRTEPHAQPLLTVGDHKGSGTITQSSSGVEGVAYPIRNIVLLKKAFIEKVLNKYFLEKKLHPLSLCKYPPTDTAAAPIDHNYIHSE